MKKIFLILICGLILGGLIMSCIRKDEPKKRTGIYYFKGFVHYKVPYEPADEISKEEALKSGNYYMAIYDVNGKLVEFKKIYDGNKVFIQANYKYGENGVVKEGVIINPEGKKIIQKFDDKGNLMQ